MRVPLLVVIALAACAPASAPALQVEQFRIQRIDRADWAAPDADDTAWPEVRLADVTEPGGPIWLRAAITVEPAAFDRSRPIGLMFAGLASHEIYWDGVAIGRGGVVGHSEDTEVPGPVAARYWVPSELAAPGRHVIALRLSAYHRSVPVAQALWLLHVGAYDRVGARQLPYTWIAATSFSGLVLGAVFALVMFFYHRTDRAFLHLSALCATAAALLVVEAWRPLVGYTYDWHGPRLVAIAALTWLLNVLVVGFTVVRLPRPRARWFVAIAAVALAAAWLVPGWDIKGGLMFIIGLGMAFGWSVRAVRRRETGSRPMALVLAVTLALLFAAPELFADLTIFYAVDLLLLCLIVPYAIERNRERAHRDRALVTAARLETELVRKHLQPHFLMNTLTALCEWIDEDPRVAGEMVGALADELRVLHDILDRPLIAMEQELRLCRAHLAIMSRRRGRAYRLVTDGVDPGAAIPPAVFHTLVENAVTHGPKRREIELRLRAERVGARVRYVFEAPLAGEEPRAVVEGAGTRYIRARLGESLGEAWSFTAGPAGGAWRTAIEVPA